MLVVRFLLYHYWWLKMTVKQISPAVSISAKLISLLWFCYHCRVKITTKRLLSCSSHSAVIASHTTLRCIDRQCLRTPSCCVTWPSRSNPSASTSSPSSWRNCAVCSKRNEVFGVGWFDWVCTAPNCYPSSERRRRIANAKRVRPRCSCLRSPANAPTVGYLSSIYLLLWNVTTLQVVW